MAFTRPSLLPVRTLQALSVCVLLVGCALGSGAREASAGERSAGATPPPTPTAARAPQQGTDAATLGAEPRRVAGTPPTAARIEADLRVVTTRLGNLDDHIGPEATRDLFARLHGHPDAYLDALQRIYVEGPLTPAQHEATFLPEVLGDLYSDAPAHTQRSARGLLDKYQRLAASSGPSQRTFAAKARDLEVLVGGVDNAPAKGAAAEMPDEICLVTVPGRERRSAIMVRRDCTCGEHLSCRVSATETSLEVNVLATPGSCRDCTRAFTTCTLPKLAPSKTYPISSGDALPHSFEALTTNASGSVVVRGSCVRGQETRPGTH